MAAYGGVVNTLAPFSGAPRRELATVASIGGTRSTGLVLEKGPQNGLAAVVDAAPTVLFSTIGGSPLASPGFTNGGGSSGPGTAVTLVVPNIGTQYVFEGGAKYRVVMSGVYTNGGTGSPLGNTTSSGLPGDYLFPVLTLPSSGAGSPVTSGIAGAGVMFYNTASTLCNSGYFANEWIFDTSPGASPGTLAITFRASTSTASLFGSNSYIASVSHLSVQRVA